MKKREQVAETDTASGASGTKVLIASYVKDNTSQGKGWIFDSSCTVHLCFQKELFNSLVAKEKETVKMMDGSACEVTGTCNAPILRYGDVTAMYIRMSKIPLHIYAKHQYR